MLADRVDWQFGNCDSTGTRAMSPLRVGSSASYRISIANKGHPWRYSSLVDSTSCQRSFTRTSAGKPYFGSRSALAKHYGQDLIRWESFDIDDQLLNFGINRVQRCLRRRPSSRP